MTNDCEFCGDVVCPESSKEHKLCKSNIRPGGRSAVELGCRCPIIDNNNGKGAFNTSGSIAQFIVSSICSLHSPLGKRDHKAIYAVMERFVLEMSRKDSQIENLKRAVNLLDQK